jgi:hypothetical protein
MQSQVSHEHTWPLQSGHLQTSQLQADSLCFVLFTAQLILALVDDEEFSPQPHEPQSQTSQEHETPSQSGQRQSAQPQPAFAVDELLAMPCRPKPSTDTSAATSSATINEDRFMRRTPTEN